MSVNFYMEWDRETLATAVCAPLEGERRNNRGWEVASPDQDSSKGRYVYNYAVASFVGNALVS